MRMSYREFCKRYLNLNKNDNTLFSDYDKDENTNWENIVNDIFDNTIGIVNQNDLAYGRTKIFLKYPILTTLENMLDNDITRDKDLRDRVKKILERYRLRNGIKNFSKILKKRKQNAENLFKSWLYKTRDYPRFVYF